MSSYIYHGGASKCCGYSGLGGGVSGGEKNYTLAYAYGLPIVAGRFINPPLADGTGWHNAHMGHHIGKASHVKGISALYQQFATSSSVQSCNLRVRRVIADGSLPVDISAGDGTLLFDLTTVFPNTGTSTDWYMGDSDFTLNVAIPANWFIYMYMQAENIVGLEGASIQLYLTED